MLHKLRQRLNRRFRIILKWIRWKRTALAVRLRRWTFDVNLAIAPFHGELSDVDRDRLADWFQSPAYQTYLKYNQIERWAQINNALPSANDTISLGRVQGSVSTINKAEFDFEAIHGIVLAKRRMDESQTEEKKLHDEFRAEYDEDTI